MSNFNEIITEKLGKFPIGVWVPYYKEDLSLAYLQEMKESGINFIPSNTCTAEELALIGESGLKMLVNDDRITYANVTGIMQVGEWASEYVDKEGVLGVFVWDEPSPVMMNICGAINTQLQNCHPQTFGFINLHPNYSDEKVQRSGLTYEEYLEYFVEHCSPKVICFDNYPFYNDGFHSKDYFLNLQMVREIALKKDLPFWSFMQSSSFGDCPVPTKGELTFQVHSNLAYGAKGILYFTYKEVTHEKNFGGGFISADGNKTDIYYYAKEINEEIEKIGDTLLTLHSKGVVFLSEEYAQYSTLNEQITANCEVMVGLFTGADGEYAYVVNLDTEHAQNATIIYRGKAYSAALKAGGGSLIKI